MRHRRASSIMYVLVLLVVLILFCSLAVDYGRVRLVRSELQTAADAAARQAATGILDGTAVSKAIAAAGSNHADGTPVVLNATDVQLGRWDAAGRRFISGGSPSDAAQVTLRKTVGLYLASLVGISSVELNDIRAVARAEFTGGYGLVGLDWINFNSNIRTDSYNASAGPYRAASAGQGGNIASNGRITLNDATIRRDLYMRPGQTLSSTDSTYGTRITIPSPLSFPTPSAGSYATSNDNASITPASVVSGTVFNADDRTVTIPAGNYYFNSFRVNSATVNVTGPVTIYVNGNVDINSSRINVAENFPRNLTFKVVRSSGATFRVNSVSSLYADIYAPTAAIDFNSVNLHFYGRVIGRTLRVNSNTFMHVDESLPRIDGAPLPPGSGVRTIVTLVH